MFFNGKPMRRVIIYIIATLATTFVCSQRLCAQELHVGGEFTTLFDNTEYAAMRGVASGTLFGARLTPKVGIEWQERNRLMVGADLYQDFGDRHFLSDAKLQLYYAYKAPRVELYAGIFPRKSMRGLNSPIFFDPAYRYYNNSIGGVLARYQDVATPSYVEFAMDYTGMRTFNTREAFAIMSSGKHAFKAYGWFSYGYDLYMGHYAKDDNPDTVDGVVDNIMVTPYIEYESDALCYMGTHALTLAARLSYVQSLQRDRINENRWEHPYGGELYVGFRWAGLELSNRLYVGGGSLLTYFDRYGKDVYHGMALYRTNKGIYDAIALAYGRRFFSNTVGVKAGITMEYDGTGWGTRQWLQVDVTLGTNIAIKGKQRAE